MKLIVQIAIITSLSFNLSLPVSAETAPMLLAETKAKVVDKEVPPANTESSKENEEESETETPPVETIEPAAIESLTVQHHVKGEALPKQTIEANPLVFLKTLKEDLLAQLEKNGKPLAVETEVNLVLSEEWSDDLGGQPPSLSMKTAVDEQGQGKSEFVVPSFKRDVPGDKTTEKAVIDWKGLQGQLIFTDKLESVTTAMIFEGFRVAEGNSFAELGKTTLGGELDADLFPVSINLNLPLFKFNEAEDKLQFNIKDVVFEGKTEKSKNNLSLGQGHLSVSQINFTEDGASSVLSDFDLKGHSELQGDVVRYVLSTRMGQLSLPEEMMGEKFDISYLSNIEFRRLDATVIAEIQKTVREMKQQQQAGMASAEMLGMIMMGKAMEVLPKLLAKSPEFALTELNLKAEQGNLQGKATVGIDGKKAVALKDMSQLILAVQAQADFSVTKTLLEQTMAMMLYEELANGEPEGKKSDEAALSKKAEKASRERIKEYLAKKYFVEADDHYQLVASLQDGKLDLNGQMTDLSKLFERSSPPAKEPSKKEK